MAEIKIFKVDKNTLSHDELQVLDVLIKVGKEIHKIWEKQVDMKTGVISLYDLGVTSAEVIEAAKINPEILSPYTIVKRDTDGQLYAVPYVEAYKNEITNIVKLLKKAKSLSKDFWYKLHIGRIIKNWEKGDFDNDLIEYLKSDNYKIGLLFGPIETYNDKLMGVKKTFQFNLRIRKDTVTDEVTQMIAISRKLPILKPKNSSIGVKGDSKIAMRVDDVVMFSGRQAGTRSASTNLPVDTDLVNRYGTRVVVYQNSLDEKFEELFLPLFKKFDNKYIDITNEANLKLGITRLIILHEICEGLIKYPETKSRLQGDETAIRELNAYLMGVKSALHQTMSGSLSEIDYSYIVSSLLVVALDKFSRMKEDNSVYEYARGFAVLFNYLKSQKAIEVGKKITVDLDKCGECIDNLANIVLSIYQEGTTVESNNLFERFGSFEIVKELKL